MQAEQLKTIVQLVAAYAHGVSSSTLQSQIAPPMTKRTLQRYLNTLINTGHLIREGKGRGTLYKAVSPATARDYTQFIPLSEQSQAIITYIEQPLSLRKHVRYNQAFLENYQPNKTGYLDSLTRKNLRQIGATHSDNQSAGTYGRAVLHELLIDLSWSSSRLEGNTYSRLDTKNLIEQGQIPKNKNPQETQMILNHKRAIEFLVKGDDEISFNRYTFLNLHGLLSENLMPDPATSGVLRKRAVDIGGSVYQPLALPQSIESAFNTILDKANAITDPFEQAFFIMVHIPYLQPFEDVNKRVSRLGANLSLLKANLCPLTFLDVSERAYIDAVLGVYELNRIDLLVDVFVWAYERSTQHYLKAKKILAMPEPTRLRYQTQIHQLVGEIVRTKNHKYTAVVKDYATQNIPMSDRETFISMAMDDIRRLHEGVLARYGLSMQDFAAWRR